MSSLVNLLDGAYKAGNILCHELIYHGIESSTNLDIINVEPLLDIYFDSDSILDIDLELEVGLEIDKNI